MSVGAPCLSRDERKRRKQSNYTCEEEGGEEEEEVEASRGRRPIGFLGLSLNDRTILFLVILLDRTVSVGLDCLCNRTLTLGVGRESAIHAYGVTLSLWRRSNSIPLE